jgi:hypothetical protein
MSFGSDVKSAHTAPTAGAILYNAPARVKGVHYATNSTSAGTIVLRDGGSTGPILLTIDTPIVTATQGFSAMVLIPDNGIRFSTNIWAAVTNTNFVTVFYG